LLRPFVTSAAGRLAAAPSDDASDRPGQTIRVDADYVNSRLGDLAKNADLSKFIL
jgi:ATP-dependent HslUV protease ATP-binding subunit HslU